MRLRRLLPILLLLLLACAPAWAVTITARTGARTWSVATDWVGDTAPVAGQDVVIPSTTVMLMDGVYGGAGFTSVNIQAGSTVNVPVASNSGLVLVGDSATGLTIAGIFQTLGSSVGNPVPLYAGVTCTISITPATDGGSGMIVTSTGANYVAISGAAKTHFVSLAADCGEWAASGDVATSGNVTSLTVDAAPTGWVDNDLLAIAPTGRTYSHWDTCLVNVAPTTTTVNVDGWQGTAPLYAAGAATKSAWNHQGTGTPTQARAEVLNLTRSFKVFSTDPTKRTAIYVNLSANARFDYVEMYNVGPAATAPATWRYGAFNATITTGSMSGTGCVIHDAARYAFFNGGPVTTGSISLANWITWNTAGHGLYIQASALSGAGAQTFTGCIFADVTLASNYGLFIVDVGSTFSQCRAIGNVSDGWHLAESAIWAPGILDNTVSHSNGGDGYYLLYGNSPAAIATAAAWRNSSAGFDAFYGTFAATAPVMFGNTSGQWFAEAGSSSVVNPTDAETIAVYQSATLRSSGGKLVVTGGTIRGTPANVGSLPLVVNGSTWTSFGAPTSFSDLGSSGVLHIVDFNGDVADKRAYYKYGSVLSNTTTRHTASGFSWQHLPTGGVGVWFRPNVPFTARCKAGVPITVRAWVQQGATYNGTNPPRIVLLGGVTAGIASDIVGDSWSGTPGTTWTQLTATASGASTPTETGLVRFVVECEGTTGYVMVDDLSAVGSPVGFAEDYFGVDGFSSVGGVSPRGMN